jgi:cytochrome c
MMAMKQFALALALGSANLASLGATPEADLARAKNCLACHGVARKIVGPALEDIAKRHADDPGAQAMLVQKVLHGSSGAWGPASMPPNQVTDADAAILVKWILSLKPAG